MSEQINPDPEQALLRANQQIEAQDIELRQLRDDVAAEKILRAELLHALRELFALVMGEAPGLLENDHHYELVTRAMINAEKAQ